MSKKIYLQLEDGTIYEGRSFGAPLIKNVIAEIVFTTAMTGYVETLSDPSYYGQMLVQTFPLVGNYGVNPYDFESKKLHLSAYIVHEHCLNPSNFRNRFDLDKLLIENNIPGICNIDTRALTKKLRSNGVMIGCLCSSPLSPKEVTALKNWKITDAVKHVSTATATHYYSILPKYHVVLWDFGAKENILRSLLHLNCDVTVVPASTTCNEILSLKPDGIILSNGPGDPKDNVTILLELQKLCACDIPIFGICLGHQLLALANGGDTEKMKYGHRGSNQPVKDTKTEKTYITSQNHGYAVKTYRIPPFSNISFINVNDHTCEGIEYHLFPGFSVQFHPEACGGPHDTEFLFQKFIDLMEGAKQTCH